MPVNDDLYKILGVETDASAVDIRRSYRRRCMETHPDKRNGDPELFNRLVDAYNILTDPSKKERYDRDGDKGTASSLEDAKAAFDRMYKEEGLLDGEADRLVTHWTATATVHGAPKDSLETEFEGFPENLQKLFHDYSLMSTAKNNRQALDSTLVSQRNRQSTNT